MILTPKRLVSMRLVSKRFVSLRLGLFAVALLSGMSSGLTLAAEYVYGTAPASARRWQDAETPSSFEVSLDDRLEVVYRKEGWVRVRQSNGPKFGWLAENQVTTVEPAGAASSVPSETLPITPNMSQEDIQRLLQERLKDMGVNQQ